MIAEIVGHRNFIFDVNIRKIRRSKVNITNYNV